jgi:hypothetical protein
MRCIAPPRALAFETAVARRHRSARSEVNERRRRKRERSCRRPLMLEAPRATRFSSATGVMMPAAPTRRRYDWLRMGFGRERVSRDVQSIGVGERRDKIDGALARSAVCEVVIGRAGRTPTNLPRLHDRSDLGGFAAPEQRATGWPEQDGPHRPSPGSRRVRALPDRFATRGLPAPLERSISLRHRCRSAGDTGQDETLNPFRRR